MPINPNTKPSEKEFQDFHAYQKNLWAAAISIWQEAQKYYFGTEDIWADYYNRNPLVAPGSRPPFHPGLFASKVDQIVNGHLAFEPKITRRPVAEGDAHEKHANLLEKGMQALTHDSFQRSPNFPTKVAGKNLVLFHYTPAITLLSTEGMTRPEKRDGESTEGFEWREWEWLSRAQHWNPIEIVIPTPGDVMMDPFEVNPPVALWKQSGTAWDLSETIMSASLRHSIYRGKYPQFDDAFTSGFSYTDPYEPREFLHWYSPRWHGIYQANGQNLVWEPNMMGIQPASHVWAGDLISPVGEKFDLGNWARQAMMYRVIDEIVMEAQAVVADHNLLVRHAWAKYVYAGDAAELAQALHTTGIIKADPNTFKLEEVPPVLPASFSHRQSLEAGIDRHTVSPLDAGFQDIRTETATGIAIKAENTSRQVQAPRAKLEHLFANVVSNASRIIYRVHKVMDGDEGERFKEIGIGDAKVRVGDMEGQFHFNVSFGQTDVATKIQAEQSMWAAFDRNVVGIEYARKVMGIENDQEAEDDVLDTMLQRDPEMLQEMLIMTARLKGLNDYAGRKELELQQMRLQRAQQRALPPGAEAAPGASVGGRGNGRTP